MKYFLENTTKRISMLSIFLCLLSCNFLTKETNAQEMEKEPKHPQQETIDDYTDTYTITPNYDMPRFKELMVRFNKQEHRFEIDSCTFKYNDQSFFIGDSVDKITTIFGEPDGGTVNSIDGEVISYVYNTLKITFRFSISERKLVNFWLFMSDHKDHTKTLYSIIVLRNIPYHLDMTLNDYLELSDLDHTKLRRRSRSFFMLQKECPPNTAERILTSIGSEAAYETEGGGHMTFTGDFDPNTSNPIETLTISLTNLEKFKE